MAEAVTYEWSLDLLIFFEFITFGLLGILEITGPMILVVSLSL